MDILNGSSDEPFRQSESEEALRFLPDNNSMELKLAPSLTALMKEQRLSLREVSKGCGVPTSTLSEWQSGRSPKNPVQVAKVAEFLGVSLHRLLFGVEDSRGLGAIEKIITDDLFKGTFEITLKRVKFPKEGS